MPSRVRPGRRVDLKSRAVGVLEEDPAGRFALGVGDDAVVVEARAFGADPGLDRAHLVDAVDLEGEVMQPGSGRGERPTLRPTWPGANVGASVEEVMLTVITEVTGEHKRLSPVRDDMLVR